MEIKPSFFSLSGFLAPGLVTSLALVAVWHTNNPQSIDSVVGYCEHHKIEGAAGFVIGTVVIALLLATTFVFGCLLSEVFIFLARTLILRPLLRKHRNAQFSGLLHKETLDELLKGNLNTREAYVYTQTCGLDLNWYAGRIRMVGGSGLGILCVSIYAYVSGLCGSAVLLFLISIVSMLVAGYRSHKFDEYVAATAAVLRFTSPKKTDEKAS